MADELEFPKIDGDILFDGDVNRFAKAGEFLKIGSSAVVSSGTAVQEAGSVLIPANTLSNPAHLKINYRTNNIGATPTQHQIGISGVDDNVFIMFGSGIATNTSKFGEVDIIFGDGISGCIFGRAFRIAVGKSNDAGFMNWNGSTVPMIDPTKENVVFFNFKAAGTEQYDSYSVQSFRGTV